MCWDGEGELGFINYLQACDPLHMLGHNKDSGISRQEWSVCMEELCP